jgi:hypothetical protein
MAIQLRGIINSSEGFIPDPIAAQVAYTEGMRFNATYVQTCEVNTLMEKIQWQLCVIDRVFFFVDQKQPVNNHGKPIDLPTQVHDLRLIIKASYNMERVVRDFAESSQAQEQWCTSACENHVKKNILNICSSLKKRTKFIEKVALQKLASIILNASLPIVVTSIIDTYIRYPLRGS